MGAFIWPHFAAPSFINPHSFLTDKALSRGLFLSLIAPVSVLRIKTGQVRDNLTKLIKKNGKKPCFWAVFFLHEAICRGIDDNTWAACGSNSTGNPQIFVKLS